MAKIRKAVAMAILLFSAAGRGFGSARTPGMVADLLTQSVTVFDADTATVLGNVRLGGYVGDCAISADGALGFVTDLSNNIWVIDLSASPPALASGVNPIHISNPGEDVALTPDGRFLLVCDGAQVAPVSVVDIAARAEVHALSLGISCNAVDVCGDGSVLISSQSAGRQVHRLILDSTGRLTDTQEALDADAPNNVTCAPGGRSAVAVDEELQSFLVPGLSPVDTSAIPYTAGHGVSAAFTPDGKLVFVRSSLALSGFTFDPETAALGPAPFFQIPLAETLIFYGMDQAAIHPDGSKLYVSNPPVVSVFDVKTRALVGTISGPGMRQPTGVCLAPAQAPIPAVIDISPGNPQNVLNPRSSGLLHVAVLTTSTASGDTVSLDATGIDVSSVRFGPAGARAVSSRLADVDHDGDLDLVLSFRTAETGIACGATSATLSGATTTGRKIDGTDSIRTVGCPPQKG